MALEIKRQTIHAAVILFALLIPYITREIILAGIAIGGFLGYYILTRQMDRQVLRKHEQHRKKEGKRTTLALFTYPFSLFLVFLILPVSLAVATWCALAVGDAAATIYGKKGKTKLIWNPKKTNRGTLAFLISTFLSTLFFVSWVDPTMSTLGLASTAITASLVGAVVESLPLEIDDNISVPLIIGLTFFISTLL